MNIAPLKAHEGGDLPPFYFLDFHDHHDISTMSLLEQPEAAHNSESDASMDFDSEKDEVESEETESEDDFIDGHSETFISRCGKVEWSNEPSRSAVGRQPLRNVIKFTDGPTPHVQPKSVRDSFELFVTNQMITDIVNFTNLEASSKMSDSAPYILREWIDTCPEEIYAYIGLLIAAGVHRSNNVDIRDLWSESRGPAIFRATMGRERFELLTKFLRFDDRSTRQERRESDKLAAFRSVWDLFIQKCLDNYIPGEEITIDEQMIPFRGRAPFKIYMRSKPDR